MDVYSIGFTQKSAQEFFETLKTNRIERLLDVRLSNTSQLAGFTKQADLAYFLKQICGAAYQHEPLLAPSEDLFRAYRKEHGSWEALASGYLKLLKARKVESLLKPADFKKRTVLLCSEATPEHCHRRLALEYLEKHWNGMRIIHL
ncbi:MAG: DUF488 domain-containing protein [Terracidiphilus sp.]